jgi:hypothetical protein
LDLLGNLEKNQKGPGPCFSPNSLRDSQEFEAKHMLISWSLVFGSPILVDGGISNHFVFPRL